MVDRLQETMAGFERGWAYTPLHGKAPILDDWQKIPPSPRHWIDSWSKKGNVGLRTGQVSGVVVIDIDTDKAGVTPEDFPPTVTVDTGSLKGWHLYYQAPQGQHINNRAGTLRDKQGNKMPGVDLRADAGQVVAVGSLHPDTGLPYIWHAGRGPDQISMAHLPAWPFKEPPRRVANPNNYQQLDPSDAEKRCLKYLGKVPMAISGQGGHGQTFYAACLCWRFNLDEDAVHRVMDWFNESKCDPPWSEKDLSHKIASARQKVDHMGERGVMLQSSPPSPTPNHQRTSNTPQPLQEVVAY